MIAIVFHPVYLWLQQRIHRRNLAALTATILVLAVVVVPTLVLGIRVTQVVRGLVSVAEREKCSTGYSDTKCNRKRVWIRRVGTGSDIKFLSSSDALGNFLTLLLFAARYKRHVLIRCSGICLVLSMELLQFYYSRIRSAVRTNGCRSIIGAGIASQSTKRISPLLA